MYLKKFTILAAVFVLIFALTTPNFASAEDADLEALWQYNDEVADRSENYIQKIVQTSPHKKKYKSKQRPILIEGAMNIEIEKLVRALKKPTVFIISQNIFSLPALTKIIPLLSYARNKGLQMPPRQPLLGLRNLIQSP